MKACVIGHPIAHSKSPIIHSYWLEKNNIVGSYEAVEIHPDTLKDGITQLIENDYAGFNVTVPHKENILSLCDEVDEVAKKIGAVNTVVIKDKKLLGTNTDAFGFIQNIKQAQPDFVFKDKTVFILGAGGATRAVIYGLINEGVSKIILTNRTQERAEELRVMAPDKIEVVPWADKFKALKNIDLLVNTTSLGMAGKPTLEMDLSGLPKEALVTDIVYAPLMTDLLSNAQARGNKIVTGIGMLLHQARPAFEKWTGFMPDVTKELEEIVLK